jgi:cell division protein FtsN
MKHWLPKLSSYLQSFTASVAVVLVCKLSLAQVVVPAEPVDPSTYSRPIILGQPKETPYVVVIPAANLQLVEKVQQYAPLAFMTASRLGSYIQAGAFADRPTAESLTYELRKQGLDARVVYLRIKL